MALPAVGATLQSAATANGNGIDFTVDGYGVSMLQVTGTFSATITFYGSIDGTNFVAISATDTNTGAIGTTATAAGIFRVNCAGYQKVRAVISGYASGTITVTGRALAVAGTQSSMLLSGRTTQVAIASALRTATASANIPVPAGVKGAIITMYVSAITGTFSAGQGVYLLTAAGAGLGSYFTAKMVSTATTTQYSRQTHIWYPGAVEGNAVDYGTVYTHKVTGLSPQPLMEIAMNITGTFDTGQGITAQIDVYFII